MVHGSGAIRQISCACIAFTPMLYKRWVYKDDPNKQPHCQPDIECTYCFVLGSFDNWNIIQFTNKITRSWYFDAVNQLVLDVISYNTSSLLWIGRYGAINAEYKTTMVYYVIKYLSDPCTLKEDQTTYGQVSKSDDLVVKE